jgi:TRAP-type C4-dicarboxylate transport system substrate-binding protein
LATPFVRRAEAQQGRVLRLGHVYEAGGVVARGIDRASEMLRERSDGRLRIEQSPAARLGSQREILQQVTDRALDLAIAPPASLAHGCTTMLFLDRPFVARDFDHVVRIFGSAFFKSCLDNLESDAVHLGVSLRAFDPWYLGTRHMTTRDRPIRAPEDMAGLRMAIGDGPTLPAMMRRLGALPVPMPEAGIRDALAAGTIDGQEGSLATVAEHGLLDLQRCLSLTGHVAMSLIPVTNTHGWHLLRDAERDLLRDALQVGGAFCTRLVRDREQRLLREFGGRDIQIAEGDRAAFRRALVPFYESLQAPWEGGTLDKMEGL